MWNAQISAGGDVRNDWRCQKCPMGRRTGILEKRIGRKEGWVVSGVEWERRAGKRVVVWAR